MELLMGCLSVVVISTVIADWVIKGKVGLSLQIPVSDISKLSSDRLLYLLTIRFCNVFDVVYGTRIWSWKRIIRSILLSFFFIVFSILIIGIEHSYVDSFRKIDMIVVITVVFSVINFLIDFISLLETRWIMENVKRTQGQSSLGAWVVADLLLSSAIYLFSFFSFIFAIFLIVEGISKFQVSLFIDIFETLFAPDKALPFFVSTFGTSIIWYLLIILSLLVRVMSRASKAMEIGWQIIFDSDAPGRIIGMIFGMFLVGIFLMIRLVSWVFS